MEFSSPLRIKKVPGTDYYKIKPVDSGDDVLFTKLLTKGKERDKGGDGTVYHSTFKLEERPRSYDQLKTVWKLVSILFVSMEGRKGTAEEQYALYEDLLQVYADKVPNSITGELRPVRISEADTPTAARFIEGLMIHLSTECVLPMGPDTEVRGLLQEWGAWRGLLEEDPLDDDASENHWRARHPYSEASGKPGPIERAHIVSRGSDEGDIEAPWNWLALTTTEHRLQHEAGWEAFIAKYPHLTGRVNRARRQAKKLGLVGKL